MDRTGRKLVRLVFQVELPHSTSESPKTWFVVNPDMQNFGDLMSVIREEFRIESGIRLCDQNGFTIPPQVPLGELNQIGELLFSVLPTHEHPMEEDATDPATVIADDNMTMTPETDDIALATRTPNSPRSSQDNPLMMLVLSPIRGHNIQESIDRSLSQRETDSPHTADSTLDNTPATSVTESDLETDEEETDDSFQEEDSSNETSLDTSTSSMSHEGSSPRKRVKFSPLISGERHGPSRMSTPSFKRPLTPFVQSKTTPFDFQISPEMSPVLEGLWATVPPTRLRHLFPGSLIKFKDDLGQQVTAEVLKVRQDTLFAKVNGDTKFICLDKISDVQKKVSCFPVLKQS